MSINHEDKIFNQDGSITSLPLGNQAEWRFVPLTSGVTVDELNGKSFKTQIETGTKHDNGKPEYDLVDSLFVDELAKVLTFGSKKYGRHNWRDGLSTSRLLAACFRHLYAFSRGEDKDPESGLLHLAHAAACIMMMIGMNKPELDDRYKKE